MLTHALVLQITDPEKYFIVCTDACKRGLGGVLMQDGHVVCYETWKLNEHEQNYLTHDLKLEVIIHALNVWRHYLLGGWFVLTSDHIGLRYLFDQLNLNARKARWLALISEFDFDIRYIQGKENRVIDALSIRIQVNKLAAMSSYGTNLQGRILQEGHEDVRYIDIVYRL